MTVSRALKPGSPVAQETRERVLRIVAKLGYVPDDIAGGLSSKRSGFVAVLVPSLNNPHFADTVGSLADTIGPSGLQILIGHTDYRPEQEERVIETMLRRRPEMIVLTYDGHTPRARRLLEGAAIPVIEIWERPRDPIGHVVGFSNRAAARALTAHLVGKGYRRIVFLGESNDRGTRGAERRKGVRDGLGAAGLDADRTMAFSPPPITMTQGAEALSQLLATWPDADAVICVSDPCAFGVLAECQRRGIAVPGRLAVAGFGDFEIARCSVPSISTVGVDAVAIGRQTGELILEIRAALLRGATLAPRIVEVPAAPIDRESS
jgi:LacI family gluconate utilization system Gnt-I transcriptional repressor